MHIKIFLQWMQKPMHIDSGAIFWQCNIYPQFLLLEKYLVLIRRFLTLILIF